MELSKGINLGPYQVDREIGRGGMGVVFLARDSRLDRQVAIKALPEFLSEAEDRLARFEQEGKLLAQLNHPNVAGIYGIEEQAGQKFLILEYVEGGTLEEHLRAGAIPVLETLLLACQTAKGLEAAHEVGVVHRDLKPGNIKITPDSEIKILDFGLAKSNRVGGSSVDKHASTMASPVQNLTEDGTILGTAPYMSPEQAAGKPVDKRTDIWAFGCVLYECLTGQRAFLGASFAELMACILNEEPDWSRLPMDTPPAVLRILKRSLAKDPKRRLRDIGDARLEIEELIRNQETGQPGLGETHVAMAPAGRIPALAIWGLVAAGLVVTSLISFLVGGSLSQDRKNPPGAVKKFNVIQGSLEESLIESFPRISPDGESLAYIRNGTVYLRDFDSFVTRKLPEATGVIAIFWSPDGNWLGYLTSNSINKIDVVSGNVLKIADAPHLVEPTDGGGWMENDEIVFECGGAGVYTVSAPGGLPHLWIEADKGQLIDFHDANAVADSNKVLYVEHRSTSEYAIMVSDGQRHVELVESTTGALLHPTYSPTGHVLFAWGEQKINLWAVPVDLELSQTTGEPFLVVSNALQPSVSNAGALVVLRNVPNFFQRGEISWVTIQGEVEPLGIMASGPVFPSISPDGKKFAYSLGDGFSERDIWLHELGTDVSSRLTFDERMAIASGWSKDQSDVAITQMDEDRKLTTLFFAADGSGESRPPLSEGIFSLDDEWNRFVTLGFDSDDPLVVCEFDPQAPSGIKKIRDFGKGRMGEISPDGALVAFSDDKEVFCKRVSKSEGLWQVSRGGGNFCKWSNDSGTLYYSNTSFDAIFAVDVVREPALRFGAPQKIMDAKQMGITLRQGWDVSPDEQRILTIKTDREDNLDDAISLITNWYEEFRSE